MEKLRSLPSTVLCGLVFEEMQSEEDFPARKRCRSHSFRERCMFGCQGRERFKMKTSRTLVNLRCSMRVRGQVSTAAFASWTAVHERCLLLLKWAELLKLFIRTGSFDNGTPFTGRLPRDR